MSGIYSMFIACPGRPSRRGLLSDWCWELHQPVASQVYLLQLMPAWPKTLTLLIKVSATVTVYRGYS